MAVKVGINGFGRIGKCVVRAAINNPDVDVVAINATGDNEGTALLLKYDSVHGTIPNKNLVRQCDDSHSGNDHQFCTRL